MEGLTPREYLYFYFVHKADFQVWHFFFRGSWIYDFLI